MNINDLKPEERKALMRQLEEEQKKEEEAIREKREEYKRLVAEVTKANFSKLSELSESLTKIKQEIFKEFQTLIELKEELYGIKENQQSHTFTADDVSITLGRRIVDNYDDTVQMGIEKVKRYLNTLTEGNKKEIESILELLLRKDKNGNLKASRVLELDKLAREIDNEDLSDGVRIIKEAYKPQKTAYFIEASFKDKLTGAKVGVPLSLTSVDIGEGYDN